MSKPSLFSPQKVGNMLLQHRVAMAPMTRFRARADYVPSDTTLTYYEQRASTPGTFIITEGTLVSEEAGGYEYIPGIYNEEQVQAWRTITSAVHAKNSFIYCQLAAVGRGGSETALAKSGHKVVSSSNIPLPGKPVPIALSLVDIKRYVSQFAQAAKNAIRAGFDGVEIHAANGYLIDQFIQDVCNNRTDEYGGSVENRNRFAMEILEAVSSAIGQSRTAIRFSPWNPSQGMRMADPIPTFSHLLTQMRERFPSLAYVHMVEATLAISSVGEAKTIQGDDESNDFARKIWSPNVYLTAGGYGPENAAQSVGVKGDVIVFASWFVSNPDLPYRLHNNIPLNPYDRSTFYVPGPNNVQGYIDYPFAH